MKKLFLTGMQTHSEPGVSALILQCFLSISQLIHILSRNPYVIKAQSATL